MKKPKAPKLVTVAITTTITIIFWIFFTLYQVLTTKPTPSVDPKLLEPIDPTLDTNSLEQMNTRAFFEEGSFTPQKIAIPTTAPEETIIPEETSEAETQSATDEGQTTE